MTPDREEIYTNSQSVSYSPDLASKRAADIRWKSVAGNQPTNRKPTSSRRIIPNNASESITNNSDDTVIDFGRVGVRPEDVGALWSDMVQWVSIMMRLEEGQFSRRDATQRLPLYAFLEHENNTGNSTTTSNMTDACFTPAPPTPAIRPQQKGGRHRIQSTNQNLGSTTSINAAASPSNLGRVPLTATQLASLARSFVQPPMSE
ncbi:Hypothetical protein, putative, partial [Bodo saltans]